MRIIYRPKGGVGMKTPFQRYNTYTDDISDKSDDKKDDNRSQDNSPSDTDSGVYKFQMLVYNLGAHRIRPSRRL